MRSGVNMNYMKRKRYLLLFSATGFFCVLAAVVFYLYSPNYKLTDEKVVLYDKPESAIVSTAFQSKSVDVPAPAFDHESGFYPDSFELQLSSSKDCKIYYTTDSSVPSDQSTLYNSPIRIRDISPDENVSHEEAGITGTEPVNKASIIRAVAYDSNGNQSQIITKAYFIDYANKTVEANLPTVSLVSDPVNLFDPKLGIYTNYLMEGWEREALFTYYSADGKQVFEQNLGVRLRGSSTRSGPLKDFTLLARSEFDGNSAIKYPLFSTPMDSLVLRHREMPQQEGFLSSLVADRDLVTQQYQMVNLYLNGEFWGVYALLGRVDEYSLSQQYNLDEDNVAYIKVNHFAEGNEQAMQLYRVLIDFLNSADMSEPETYQKACEQIDMQSLIDYYVTSIYLNNIDTNPFYINSLMWRSLDVTDRAYADGKWRFGLYDLDHAIVTDGFELVDDPAVQNLKSAASFNCFTEFYPYGAAGPIEDPILNNLMGNTEFRQQFYDTFMEIAKTNFDPDRVQQLIAKLPYSEGNAQTGEFFANRPKYIFGYLDDFMQNGRANFNRAQAEALPEDETPTILQHGATTPLLLAAFAVLFVLLGAVYVHQNGGFHLRNGGK